MNISEAERQEQINKASGEAAGILAVAEARAKGLKMVASSLTIKDGKNAASFSVAEQYVTAFDKLARTTNTLILPANAADISGVVGQAMTIYKNLSNHNLKLEEADKIDEQNAKYSDDGKKSNDSNFVDGTMYKNDSTSNVVDRNIKK